MKSKESQSGSITQPLLKELMDREKLNRKIQPPVVESKPLDPPSLYQDAGNGYNSDFTFRQQ
jgi:hypothetical protein